MELDAQGRKRDKSRDNCDYPIGNGYQLSPDQHIRLGPCRATAFAADERVGCVANLDFARITRSPCGGLLPLWAGCVGQGAYFMASQRTRPGLHSCVLARN